MHAKKRCDESWDDKAKSTGRAIRNRSVPAHALGPEIGSRAPIEYFQGDLQGLQLLHEWCAESAKDTHRAAVQPAELCRPALGWSR
jgi:hypothetical protein